MKAIINSTHRALSAICFACCMLLPSTFVRAQENTAPAATKAPEPTEEPTPDEVVAPAPKPVKNTFQSTLIIDNQTVMVPVKKTLEFYIMHRFGTINSGFSDLWGLYAPSNIRFALNYSPIDNLNLGMGLTKEHMLWDGNAKYALLRQTPGKYPVSVTYYGNMAYDLRKDPDHSIFKYESQRWSFFNQLIIARKINDKLSIQVAPSVSHQNSVNGYYTKNDSTGKDIFNEMKFDHFAVAVSARYRLTDVTALLFNYDQPLTGHPTNNPNPNFSFGFEFSTSAHAFQFFLTNYSLLSPQQDNLYNSNNPFGYTDKDNNKVPGGEFLIGFNITRLWNY